MSQLFDMDVLNAIAQRTGLTFERMMDFVQAQILGFINPHEHWKVKMLQNIPLWKFPEPDKRYKPVLKRSLMRVDISVSFSGAAPKMLIRTYNSQETFDEQVLNGSAFVTLVSKSFDKQMTFGERYNILFDQDCTIEYLKITEIPTNS